MPVITLGDSYQQNITKTASAAKYILQEVKKVASIVQNSVLVDINHNVLNVASIVAVFTKNKGKQNLGPQTE